MNWRRAFLIVGIIFSLNLVYLGVKYWRDESVIGEIHLLRDRQMLTQNSFLRGWGGRLVSNKPLIVLGRIQNRVLEAMDLNIIFTAGHPNERSAVLEFEWVPWWLFPIFLWGLWLLVVMKKYQTPAKLLLMVWILGITISINFPVIIEKALIGTFTAIYFVIGIGLYDLFFLAYEKYKK